MEEANQEIEVKLRTDQDKIDRIRRSRWWRELEPVQRKDLHSIYFDTDDLQLRDNNISLRTRSDGHAIVQTLKVTKRPSDTVARSEWETLVPDPIPDPSLVIDPSLPPSFRKLTSADLQPVFDVDVKRETRRLTSERAKIDVSIDHGAVVAGRERQALNEVELELVDGELDALFAEAQRISDEIDGRLHARTKADVGYDLGRSDRKHWSRAPKLRLAGDMTAGESFRLIVLNSLAHLTANDDCARLNLHVEGVHQCRIALRRLRSAMKIYRPLLRRKRIERAGEAVGWLGKVLGTARDLDVLQTELLQPAVDALGEAEQLAPLMARVEARRAEAYVAVNEALSSSRYRHLLIDLCALGHARDIGKRGEGTPGLEQPLADVASAALSRAHQKLLEQGENFAQLSKNERHDLRIALKRLRYALDFFERVFKSDARKEFIKRLRRLQDDLGGMNDVAVAETMLARFAGVGVAETDAAARVAQQGQLAFSAGGILGWHRRRAAETEVHLQKDWDAFVRAKPFWLGDQVFAR
jgi:inorganic triphosphatase YgiF